MYRQVVLLCVATMIASGLPLLGAAAAAPLPKNRAASPGVHPVFGWGLEDVIAPGCRLAIEDLMRGQDCIDYVEVPMPGWISAEVYRGPVFIQRGSPPKPPERQLDPKQLVSFLRKRLPARWQVRLSDTDQRVVLIALKKLLKWKHNPLGRRVTIKGVYTIRQIEKKFIAKACPGIIFCNVLPSLPGTGGNPAAPDYKNIRTPLRFDIKGMTIRHLLTSGFDHRVVYDPMPWWTSRGMWHASFSLHHGHIGPTVYLNINFYHVHLLASAVVRKPKAAAKAAGGIR